MKFASYPRNQYGAKVHMEKGVKMKVSIIIPIYNTEKYLKRCLDSVFGQDYDNIEVILVDDGSTDGSSDIIKEYLQQHNNAILIKQENGGVGAARNAGLAVATGEYLCFVDSDDFIYPDFCSYLLGIIGDADIAVAGRNKYINDVYVKSKTASSIIYATPVEAINLMLEAKYNTRPAWGKLYKRDTIRDVRFVQGHIFEEIRYSADTFLASKKIVFANKDLYSYRIREGSIMTSNKDRHIRDLTLSYEHVYRLLCEKDVFNECEDAFRQWLVRLVMYNLNLFFEHDVDVEIYKQSAKVLLDIYLEVGGLGGRLW